MSGMSFEIKGMKALITAVDEIGKLPQKCVRGAARKGADIAMKAARVNAPVYTGPAIEGVVPGALKKGITKKEERSRTKGKAVFDVMMDPKKNEIFVKMSGDKRAYYPASMEYGFLTKSGNKIPGHHFLRNSLTENKDAIEEAVCEELVRRMLAEWAKGG